MHGRIRKFVSAELVGSFDGPVWLISGSPLHEDGPGAGAGGGAGAGAGSEGSGDDGGGAGAGSEGDGSGGDGAGEGDGSDGDGDGKGEKTYSRKYVEQVRREAANARERARQAEERATAAERATQSEQERAVAEAKEAGLKEGRSAGNQRVLNATIRALAAGQWADPADATKYVDISKYEVGDDGDFDEQQIADDLAKVLEDKPYLRATTEAARPARGGADGGPRSKGEQRPQTLEAAAAAAMKGQFRK